MHLEHAALVAVAGLQPAVVHRQERQDYVLAPLEFADSRFGDPNDLQPCCAMFARSLSSSAMAGSLAKA